jgi:hypothetical protein
MFSYLTIIPMIMPPLVGVMGFVFFFFFALRNFLA